MFYTAAVLTAGLFYRRLRRLYNYVLHTRHQLNSAVYSNGRVKKKKNVKITITYGAIIVAPAL